jgi:hypothetical protein
MIEGVVAITREIDACRGGALGMALEGPPPQMATTYRGGA